MPLGLPGQPPEAASHTASLRAATLSLVTRRRIEPGPVSASDRGFISRFPHLNAGVSRDMERWLAASHGTEQPPAHDSIPGCTKGRLLRRPHKASDGRAHNEQGAPRNGTQSQYPLVVSGGAGKFEDTLVITVGDGTCWTRPGFSPRPILTL